MDILTKIVTGIILLINYAFGTDYNLSSVIETPPLEEEIRQDFTFDKGIIADSVNANYQLGIGDNYEQPPLDIK